MAVGLAGVLVTTAAFINIRNARTLKDLKTGTDGKGFAVVELFTSEGCSSCPPADKLLEQIQADNRNRQIYLLAFHVDYWDHQGWKDRFSDAEYSKRQGRYADWLNLRTIYTPQIVINGSSEYVGSDQSSVLQAIAAGLDQQATGTLTVTGKKEGDRLAIEYQAAGNGKKSELVLALVQRSAQSNVRGGENTGRKLSHVQVVRRMVHFPLGANGNKGVSMKLPDDFNESGWELIGFVQDNTNGHITAAARLELRG
jgi:hypothetical protein